MPVRTNFLEGMLFYNLNLAPVPLLDLAGALSYQAVATAARLNVFQSLGEQTLTPAELAQQIDADERGIAALLQALTAIGYVRQMGDRYANSKSTTKWLQDGDEFDIAAAVTYWSAVLEEIWPQAIDIIKSGERSFNFYQWVEENLDLSQAFQKMMAISAKLIGPDIAKKLALPSTAKRVLDVAGGQVAVWEQVEGKVSGTASNAFVHLIALQYFLAVGGRVYSREDIQGLLGRTGFKHIRFRKLTRSPGTSLATATKSATL